MKPTFANIIYLHIMISCEEILETAKNSSFLQQIKAKMEQKLKTTTIKDHTTKRD
jgi:hypothetical protein